MNGKSRRSKASIRYSEAFKMAVVREVEEGDLSFAEIKRKYGIKGGTTLRRWLGQYGNGSEGKVIRVERPEEVNELKQLKTRVRQLERVLGDANIDAALERAYTRIACARAGITDVEEFKKKAAGQLDTKR
jgi:transposase-like protein